MEKVMDHLNGELKGRPLGQVRQKRLADSLLTTCEATGTKPRERIAVDGSVVSGDEADDKFMKALGGIREAMKENAQHQSEMMKFVLEKKKGGSPGKGRSPSGLLRKKARSGASASSSAGASGSAGPLVRNLFEIGSDEEDEDEMEEDDAQQGAGMMIQELIETHDDLFKNTDKIKWGSTGTGPAAMKKYDETQPLLDVNPDLLGPNRDPNCKVMIPLDKITQWQMEFSAEVFAEAKGMMVPVMEFWKKCGCPGKRMVSILQTWTVAVKDGEPNRKHTTLILALILASKKLGTSLPAIP